MRSFNDLLRWVAYRRVSQVEHTERVESVGELSGRRCPHEGNDMAVGDNRSDIGAPEATKTARIVSAESA
jgi:hypothetical protein